ncbi:hypothetical protein [Galbibacter sp. PAP.153]|uniref:hypothetical protein n=1 Tax=Galbibacter sp. PAP.153 TaxID=3104623 RepID=UPI00300B2A57
MFFKKKSKSPVEILFREYEAEVKKAIKETPIDLNNPMAGVLVLGIIANLKKASIQDASNLSIYFSLSEMETEATIDLAIDKVKNKYLK